MKKLLALITLAGILFLALPQKAEATGTPCRTIVIYCCGVGHTCMICDAEDAGAWYSIFCGCAVQY